MTINRSGRLQNQSSIDFSKGKGGTIIETESEKLIRQGISQGMRQGQAKMAIEIGQEDGLDEAAILRKLQDKIDMSAEEAEEYMKEYGRQ